MVNVDLRGCLEETFELAADSGGDGGGERTNGPQNQVEVHECAPPPTPFVRREGYKTDLAEPGEASPVPCGIDPIQCSSAQRRIDPTWVVGVTLA